MNPQLTVKTFTRDKNTYIYILKKKQNTVIKYFFKCNSATDDLKNLRQKTNLCNKKYIWKYTVMLIQMCFKIKQNSNDAKIKCDAFFL